MLAVVAQADQDLLAEKEPIILVDLDKHFPSPHGYGEHLLEPPGILNDARTDADHVADNPVARIRQGGDPGPLTDGYPAVGLLMDESSYV